MGYGGGGAAHSYGQDRQEHHFVAGCSISLVEHGRKSVEGRYLREMGECRGG